MELQLGDFRQVEVFIQGARYVWRSRPYPVIGLETLNGLEAALHLRTAFPPQTKYSQGYRSKVRGTPASCIDARPPFGKKLRFCFDPQTGALLEASDARGWRGRFSEYAAAGKGMFPGRMELTLPGEPRHLEFADIHVTSQSFDDARFVPPQGALAFTSCDGMAAAPLADRDWTVILNRQKGEVYLYAIVEADGRVHDLKAYGTNDKWLQREAAKHAGVPNWFEVSPHWLRHCHGSHAIDRKAPLTVVRDTLGHSNIAVTNEYAKARPDQSSSHYLPI